MSAIIAFLTPYATQIFAGVGGLLAVIIAALGIRKSGADAARTEAEKRDAQHADTIRKAGADARARVDAAPSERLRDDDGFKQR